MIEPLGLVSGRYRLGELLGTGGSASVFAAVDTGSGTPVALKLLHPHLSGSPTARDAFLAEARRMQDLRHPNIAGVLDVGVDTGSLEPVAWIALERADGASLAEHVGRFGRLSVAEAAAVLDGILAALEAAHGMGLVHRDISPANVMVSRAGAGVVTVEGVRLLDFGLADAAGRAATGTDILRSEAAGEAAGRAGVIGNVDYMSPEQARGAAVDERGDVYQAGAVLYFALTGRRPFTRPTAAETMRAHRESPPPVPSVLAPGVPRQLDRIVVRALLKDPADRFGSAAEMRTALTEIVGSAPDAHPDGGRGARATRAPASRPPRDGPVRTLDDEAVTKVLGSTSVPTRSTADAHTAIQRRRPVRRAAAGRRPGLIGAWISGGGLAVIIATILASVAASSPAVPVPSPPASQAEAVPPPPTAVPTASDAPIEHPDPVILAVVPDVASSSLPDAIRSLTDAGLAVGEVAAVDSERSADTVLASSPGAGAALETGSTVSLTVASGFNRIPEVVGLERADALMALQRAGFTVSIRSRPTAGVDAGSIVGTDPGSGVLLAVTTTVTLLEAAAAPRETTPPTPTATPTPTPTARDKRG